MANLDVTINYLSDNMDSLPTTLEERSGQGRAAFLCQRDWVLWLDYGLVFGRGRDLDMGGRASRDLDFQSWVEIGRALLSWHQESAS